MPVPIHVIRLASDGLPLTDGLAHRRAHRHADAHRRHERDLQVTKNPAGGRQVRRPEPADDRQLKNRPGRDVGEESRTGGPAHPAEPAHLLAVPPPGLPRFEPRCRSCRNTSRTTGKRHEEPWQRRWPRPPPRPPWPGNPTCPTPRHRPERHSPATLKVTETVLTPGRWIPLKKLSRAMVAAAIPRLSRRMWV